MLFSFLKQMLAKILQYPITQETFLAQWRFVKRRIYQILGMKGRTAFITAPHCRAHFMNDLHPESPMRLQVIEQALKKTHIWARMQKIVAPEVSDVQLARVHTRQYLHSLENQVPENGTVKIAEDTYLSRDSLQAARFAAGAVVKAVDMVMKKHAKNAFCGVRPLVITPMQIKRADFVSSTMSRWVPCTPLPNTAWRGWRLLILTCIMAMAPKTFSKTTRA